MLVSIIKVIGTSLGQPLEAKKHWWNAFCDGYGYVCFVFITPKKCNLLRAYTE